MQRFSKLHKSHNCIPVSQAAITTITNQMLKGENSDPISVLLNCLN